MIEYLGNTDMLKQPMTAFLAPSKIAPESVLPTLDWATEMARSGHVVVSGFSSKLETDVWDVLVRNGSPVVEVKVTSNYKQLPSKYRPLLDNGQLLLIFLNLGNRLNRNNARQRNLYVTSLSSEIVFSSINKDSTLYPLYRTLLISNKHVMIINNR